MWHDLYAIQIPVPEKLIRTVAVYAILALLFRFFGKRGLASLNTFDFVVMFLLSNVVQNAIIGNDNSLLGGVIGAVTLLVVNDLVNRWLARSNRMERLLEGQESVVIRDGEVQTDELRRLSIRPAELEQAVRVQNGDATSDVAIGLLAPSGHFVLSLKPGAQNATKADVEAMLGRLAALQDQLAEVRGQLAALRPPGPGGPSSDDPAG